MGRDVISSDHGKNNILPNKNVNRAYKCWERSTSEDDGLALQAQIAPNLEILCSLQIRSIGRFSVLEQGLLIHQLTQEDAGIYQCQGMEHTFSHIITSYNLRIIGHQAMEVLTSRLSRSPEEAGKHHHTTPISEMHHQGYLWALRAPGTNLDEFCSALKQRKRRRQKAWNQKWQQHPLGSKKGRVRREPGLL